ncbi:hypothetical protein D1AOALGA4SA_7379 [Olavius algarvensis Delta 1 endosymbiont]|nr:hypothetical protein D1AOALGA4SA_7379 [Olavius algarvensis Delta 1 endosymbiont]
MVSGFRCQHGIHLKSDRPDRKRNIKMRISNIEQVIVNVEVRYSIHLKLSGIVRAKRFHTSLFDISCSIFCGSL